MDLGHTSDTVNQNTHLTGSGGCRPHYSWQHEGLLKQVCVLDLLGKNLLLWQMSFNFFLNLHTMTIAQLMKWSNMFIWCTITIIIIPGNAPAYNKWMKYNNFPLHGRHVHQIILNLRKLMYIDYHDHYRWLTLPPYAELLNLASSWHQPNHPESLVVLWLWRCGKSMYKW